MNKLFTCLWCGFSVFHEVFSGYEICPICNFQDDSSVLDDPFLKYYKSDTPLIKRQRNILEKYPLNIQEVTLNGISYKRNKNWNCINESTFVRGEPFFPTWKYEEFYEKYWEDKIYNDLMRVAQQYNPDEEVFNKSNLL